jgi:hypothetical protein
MFKNTPEHNNDILKCFPFQMLHLCSKAVECERGIILVLGINSSVTLINWATESRPFNQPTKMP